MSAGSLTRRALGSVVACALAALAVGCSSPPPILVGGGSGGDGGGDGGTAAGGGGTAGQGGGSTGGGSGLGGAGAGGGGGAVVDVPIDAGFVLPFPLETQGLSVAVDAQGGVHAAALATTGVTLWLWYGACAAHCEQADRWHAAAVVLVSADDGLVGLGVTADGRPRAAVLRTAQGSVDYVSCETGCLAPSGWTSVRVVDQPPGFLHPFASEAGAFAVGASGQAALVYSTSFGAYVTRCAGSCGSASGWTTVNLGAGLPLWVDPQVAFAPSGALGIAVQLFDITSPPPRVIGFFECRPGVDCARSLNWGPGTFNGSTGEARLTLTYDGASRPWVGLFYDGVDAAHASTVELASCLGGGCSASAGWTVATLPWTAGGSVSVKRVASSVDAAGRLRLATRSSAAAELGRCASGCQSPANWTHATVLSPGVLGPVVPLATPCAFGQWHFEDGHFSMWALPRAGPGVVLGVDLQAVPVGGSCTPAGSPFERRGLVAQVP